MVHCLIITLSSKPKIWWFYVVVLWSTAKKCMEIGAARTALVFFPFNLCGVVVSITVSVMANHCHPPHLSFLGFRQNLPWEHEKERQKSKQIQQWESCIRLRKSKETTTRCCLASERQLRHKTQPYLEDRRLSRRRSEANVCRKLASLRLNKVFNVVYAVVYTGVFEAWIITFFWSVTHCFASRIFLLSSRTLTACTGSVS